MIYRQYKQPCLSSIHKQRKSTLWKRHMAPSGFSMAYTTIWVVNASFTRAGRNCAMVVYNRQSRITLEQRLRQAISRPSTQGSRATVYDILELMGKVHL